tara:strand:- start:556 stop:753 length:198 start_codon:yes stop_codon:yes gene_type:complete
MRKPGIKFHPQCHPELTLILEAGNFQVDKGRTESLKPASVLMYKYSGQTWKTGIKFLSFQLSDLP